MSSSLAPQPTAERVLATALVNAGKELGLTQASLGAIVGKERTAFARGSLDPASKSGELALLFLRAYRALFALTGGDRTAMRHWIATENRHTGGVPVEQMRSVQGLARVVEYLDAVRGKL